MVDALCERMTVLAKAERFEDAGALRDRLRHLVRGLARAQRLAPLAASPELVAARRTDAGAWELVCVRHGRLAGTSLAPRGADPLVYVESLRATAEAVPPPVGPAPAAYPEETELVLRWLESPGVRIVSLDGEWTCPVGGAGAAKATFDDLRRGA